MKLLDRKPGEKKRKGEWVEYLPIRRTKLRSYLMTGGVLIGLLDLNHIDLVPFTIGAVFMAAAAWVHVWSKGHLDKNASLTRSGPYRWVRDPFHFSNFFMDLGLLLIINNWIYTAVMMVFWVIAYSHRLGEEDQMLLELFGDDYRDYRARIPRMIPYKKPMDKKYDKPFSIYHAPIYHGKVCKRLFRFSSYPFLLLAAAWAGDHGLAVLDVDQHPFFYWAVCGYLFFHWLGEASAELTARRRSLLPGWLQRQPVPTLLAAAWIGLLWWVEQLPLDTAVFEVHLNVPGVAAVLLTLVVVLALICPPQHWKSYRFHRLIEGLGLSVLCLFTPLPWLALVPACYFSALFLYGHPGQAEPDLDHVFSVRDDAQVMAEPRYMGALLVFYAVQTPIMIF